MGGTLHNALLLRALRGEPVERTPVWLMRQAGRYQKSYRDLRAKVSMLDLCKKPELACQVTVAAVEEIRPDAAIIFSDLLLPAELLGFKLEYLPDEGPKLSPPIRSAADVDRLPAGVTSEGLVFAYESLRLTRAALPADMPLLGFAAAPFTLASYLIEGAGSHAHALTKTFMRAEPAAWAKLMDLLADLLADYLNRQADAGAQAVQVFDSWVGCLSPGDYREKVMPHSRRLLSKVRKDLPVIHFGTGTSSFLELMKEAGGGCLGLDWRVDIAEARKRLGTLPVMGNLDPTALFGPKEEIRRLTHLILKKAGPLGHVFNLGHGVLPGTPADNVKFLVDVVRDSRV
jgi:uroporphyrinogen decarboxylase